VNPVVTVELLNRLERALLKRRPVFDPGKIARRLLGDESLAPLLRWGYATALARVQRRFRVHPLVFGPAVALCELLLMPAVGATPKVKRWPRGEVPLLFAHATSFALAAG
jgi:hypothetical protein